MTKKLEENLRKPVSRDQVGQKRREREQGIRYAAGKLPQAVRALACSTEPLRERLALARRELVATKESNMPTQEARVEWRQLWTYLKKLDGLDDESLLRAANLLCDLHVTLGRKE